MKKDGGSFMDTGKRFVQFIYRGHPYQWPEEEEEEIGLYESLAETYREFTGRRYGSHLSEKDIETKMEELQEMDSNF